MRHAAGGPQESCLLEWPRGKIAEAVQELARAVVLQTREEGVRTVAEESMDTQHKPRRREHPSKAVDEQLEQRRRGSSMVIQKGVLTWRFASPTTMWVV